MRDILVAEFKRMATVLATHTARRAFMGHYAKAKKANAELAQRLTLDVSMQANHEVQLIDQGDYTCADARINTMMGGRQQRPRIGLTVCPDLVDHYSHTRPQE